MRNRIWDDCKGKHFLVTLKLAAWRMVEAQHFTATRKLVDTLEEQHLLEEMIEETKPPFKETSLELHYLLSTPFRYPPLKNGSRFGGRFEPSLWYGSLGINTAMAETAFYRFHFLRASRAEFGNVITSHTLFSVSIGSKRGIDLTQAPFKKFTAHISSPLSYLASQSLGAAMRNDQIEAVCYQSARDPDQGKNMALFTPKAFSQKNPDAKSFQTWQCILNRKKADFIRMSSITPETFSFPVELLMVEGVLPFPA